MFIKALVCQSQASEIFLLLTVNILKLYHPHIFQQEEYQQRDLQTPALSEQFNSFTILWMKTTRFSPLNYQMQSSYAN